MKHHQQPTDEEQFQILLSREDYEELKRCKEAYSHLQTDSSLKIKSLQSQNTKLVRKFELVLIENKEMKNSRQEVDDLVERMYLSVKERHQQLFLTYQSELPLLSKNQSYQGRNGPNILINSKDRILSTQSSIDEIFKIFSLALQKQHEKVANLIRQTVSLKQQNSTIKDSISDKINELKICGIQKQRIEEKYIKEINRLQDIIKDLQRVNHQIKRHQVQAQQQKQQILALNKKLSAAVQQCNFLTKQNQLLSEQNGQYMKQNRQLQDQVKQYQQHITILKLKEANSRKSPPKSTKFEKEDYIKETLVEYVREIRKNLISIGNLSQEEIKQIGSSELRTLVKFIQELEEDLQ